MDDAIYRKCDEANYDARNVGRVVITLLMIVLLPFAVVLGAAYGTLAGAFNGAVWLWGEFRALWTNPEDLSPRGRG